MILRVKNPSRNLILLVGFDPPGEALLRESLRTSDGHSYGFDRVGSYADAQYRLDDSTRTGTRSTSRYSALIVDLVMPGDPQAGEFEKLYLAALPTPILVLCDAMDEASGLLAVRHGAQDYLLKQHINAYLLPKTLRSMIERAAIAATLFDAEERAQVTLNSIGDAVISTDLDGRVTYLNAVASGMTGWSLDEAQGRPLHSVCRLVNATSRQPVRNPVALAMTENRPKGLIPDCVLIRRDGHEAAIEDSIAPIHDRRGTVTGAVIVFRDVTIARAAAARMSHLAQHDTLTDLPNRAMFRERLSQALAMARRMRHSLAVLFLDVDRFKAINDRLGHEVGDQVLIGVSQRLLACVRASDSVSRQGGDEFVVLLAEVTEPADAAMIARKILESVSAMTDGDTNALHVTASTGIATYPGDAVTADDLLRRADLAMFCAKAQGRNNWQFYDPTMNDDVVQRALVETELRDALGSNQLALHFQPIVSLAGGTITGVEALLRWHHPRRGILPPAEFLPVAEQCGLSRQLSHWVLTEACRQSRAWLNAGHAPLTIAVNVSPTELRRTGYAAEVQAILTATDCPAQSLVLELVESSLLRSDAATATVAAELQSLGVRLALDDFGTGFASLTHLRDFPIAILKIDQSFVRDIALGGDNSCIADAVIGLAASLHVAVIAEGVETIDQLMWLCQRGCESAQGYYFSRPVCAEAMGKLLRFARTLPAANPQGAVWTPSAIDRICAVHAFTVSGRHAPRSQEAR
jgi:diguanylate cyclase (GGDEF)-like protein/PAS domain S-box-containing protein